jgi:hypothetical protein
MASIGGVTCTFVRGHPPYPKERVLLWTAPGIDGVGAQQVGRNDAEFQVQAVLYSSAPGILAWKLAIEALQGTLVTIVNDLGIAFTRCLIAKVSNMRSQAAKVPGTTITQRGEIIIEGVVT